jgi:putative sugar O-methyltransferase
LSSISEIIVCEEILSESSLVCEIGGGSGRSSDVILQQFPKTKLIYCDIPPASFIALTRFRLMFPDKIIYIVKNSDEFQMLLSNTDSWDILMISPLMLDYMPKGCIDLLIAIDCLHEFSNENRAKLAGIIAKVTKFFYTKNWTDTVIPFDEIPLSSNHLSGYYFPEHWKTLHNKPALFPGNFTEILFRVTEIENL